MRRIVTVLLSVVLSLAMLRGSASSAATLRWVDGGTNVARNMSQAPICTLVVTRDAGLANIDGFRTIWSGNGRLQFASEVAVAGIPTTPDRSPTQRDLADARSHRATLDLGFRDGSSETRLVVRVLSGNKFDISLVEVADGRALLWPLESQPTLTINGGLGRPVRPEIIGVAPRVVGDSVTFWLTGLGFSRARIVGCVGVGTPRNLPFAIFGDTAIQVSCPLKRAAQVRALVVRDSVAVGSAIEADVRSILPRTKPIQIIARLSSGAPDDVLVGLPGVLTSKPVVPRRTSPQSSRSRRLEDLSSIQIVSVANGADPARLLSTIRAHALVRSADELRSGADWYAEPNDQLWNEQWGFHQVLGSHCNGTLIPEPNSSINLPEAWDTAPFAQDVNISIIDSGVRASHVDLELAADSLNQSFDEFYPDPATDESGHGTAVASIAAALTHNASGMAGASRLGRPASLKTNLSTDSLLAALEFAGQPTSPPIINMSWGADEYVFDPTSLSALRRVCKNAFMTGHLLVASAGNSHDSVRTAPAGFDEYVTAVGATLWNNLIWTDANAHPDGDSLHGSKYGSWVDVMAPGGLGITAAWGESDSAYWSLDQATGGPWPCNIGWFNPNAGFGGTSAAAPVVAGTAAWLKKIQPTLTGEDLAQVLERTTTDLGSPGRDTFYAKGRINAAAAAAFVSRPHWIEHGSIGAGSGAPLWMQADSVMDIIVIQNSDDPSLPDSAYVCVRYHLVGVKALSGDFVSQPAVWVRRADTDGMPPVSFWDDDRQPPWGAVTYADADHVWLETYVYRLLDFGNRFFPCSPSDAVISYTAIGTSGTLDVVPQAGQIGLAIRTRHSPVYSRAVFDATGLGPGALRVEVFDVTGRRVATLFEGRFVGGPSTFEWDGRDQGAMVCRAGMYICRVEQPGRRSACRFAFLR